MEKTSLSTTRYYQKIKELRAARPDNPNHYTSFYDDDPMQGMDWDDLKKEISDHALNFASTAFNIRYKKPVITAWWNLYDLKCHHCWHHHTHSLISGTFYVHTDSDSVGIEFKSPLESLIKAHCGSFGDETRWKQNVMINPEPGDILMWPSWLDHSVPEQKTVGDDLRCSISFNVSLR